jgi:hypothetical protein
VTEPHATQATPRPYRGLLVYAVLATPIAVIVALLASGWLTAWDGALVSMRPPPEDEALWARVLVVEDDGTNRELRWPLRAVKGLDVRLDPAAIPPVRVPPDAIRTRKALGELTFTVSPPGGATRRIATTSPQAAAVAVLAWLVGLFLRNMLVSGNPLDITPRPATLPAPLPPPGVPSRPDAPRGVYQPPPARTRGGRKRRKR